MAEVVFRVGDEEERCIGVGRALAGDVTIATAGAVIRALSAATNWVVETISKVNELAKKLAQEHGLARDSCKPLWVAMGVLIGLLESGRARDDKESIVVDGVPVTAHWALVEFAKAFRVSNVGGYVVKPLVTSSGGYPSPGLLAEEPGTGLRLILGERGAMTADGERISRSWSLESVPELMQKAKYITEAKTLVSRVRSAAEEAADVLAEELGMPRDKALKAVLSGMWLAS